MLSFQFDRIEVVGAAIDLDSSGLFDNAHSMVDVESLDLDDLAQRLPSVLLGDTCEKRFHALILCRESNCQAELDSSDFRLVEGLLDHFGISLFGFDSEAGGLSIAAGTNLTILVVDFAEAC